MANKKFKELGVTFKGPVTFNGSMFDIHDNQHVHVNMSGQLPQQADDEYEYVDLCFFDGQRFGTMEQQGGSAQCAEGCVAKN